MAEEDDDEGSFFPLVLLDNAYLGVDTLVSRSYRDGGFFLTWMLLLFQQVCRAKRLYKGKFIDHQGCFRPIKKYRLIAGELPESDTIQDDRARKAIESAEKSHEEVLQEPLLYSSGEDDNNSFLGHSVEVPNNQSVYSPARVPYDPPVDSNVGKTPKIKNKKRQQSTKKEQKEIPTRGRRRRSTDRRPNGVCDQTCFTWKKRRSDTPS